MVLNWIIGLRQFGCSLIDWLVSLLRFDLYLLVCYFWFIRPAISSTDTGPCTILMLLLAISSWLIDFWYLKTLLLVIFLIWILLIVLNIFNNNHITGFAFLLYLFAPDLTQFLFVTLFCINYFAFVILTRVIFIHVSPGHSGSRPQGWLYLLTFRLLLFLTCLAPSLVCSKVLSVHCIWIDICISEGLLALSCRLIVLALIVEDATA